MKKIYILTLLILLILPSILAINLKIEKQNDDEAIILGLDKPAVFNLKVTNLGFSDYFQFYNLIGLRMIPSGSVQINSAETKDIQLMIYTQENFDYRGFYTFEYRVQGSDYSEVKDRLTIKIVELKDAFEVGSGEVDPESNMIKIYIHNKENFNFGEMNAKFSSPFFNFGEDLTLGPNEKKEFSVKLNKEDFKKLMAGFYTLNVEVDINGKKEKIEGIIKFIEKDISTEIKNEYGFFIHTRKIIKTNEGNILTNSGIVIKKNIISRLFTTITPEPSNVERRGFNVDYTWNQKIKPGESLNIIIKTNWFFPLLIILFIVMIVALAKKYSENDLVMNKKVSFVNAKGGEFALKVSILVNAKKYIEKVDIIDRLPNLVKVYERFGGETPKKVDEKNKRVEWHFEKLEAGETRVISYIIYSKVGVFGKFALPSAAAVYERNGEVKESQSNRAFFVAEQRTKDVED
ncbi:MAG: hypothetical protein KKA64_03865 [Nanoarchaeota archaeon]|nr:hypothetical protein [Nanoarchaeota archaeon]